MEFEYPEILLLLPLLGYCLYRCKERTAPIYYVHLHFFGRNEGRIDRLFWYKMGTIFWLLVALASPVVLDRFDPRNRHGVAMAIALDASGSMVGRGFDTQNIQMTKFESVQSVLTHFVDKRVNDNIAIVLFGDFAFVASPLTYEKEPLRTMISYLTLGMAGENTALGDGLATAVSTLERSEAKSKIVILMTDGMHNSGTISPKEAVALAQEANVKIYTIGIGGEGDYDRALMQTIAQEGGGAFFAASSHEALEEVYASIDALEASSLRSRDYPYKHYWYAVALLLAMLFMLAYVHRRWGLSIRGGA